MTEAVSYKLYKFEGIKITNNSTQDVKILKWKSMEVNIFRYIMSNRLGNYNNPIMLFMFDEVF